MKKIIYLLALTAATLIGTASFAFVNNKNSCQPDLFYCPQQITCSQDGKLDSCKITGASDKVEYWNVGQMINDGRVAFGVYTFSHATSSYQIPNPDNNYATCNYSFSSPGRARTLHFSSKKTAYVEASFNNVGNAKSWRIDGYQASCSKTNVESCPFLESGLYVNKRKDSASLARVQLSANGVVIKNDINPPDDDSSSLLAIYDEALPACGGVQQCKIDIDIDTSTAKKPTYSTHLGSVVVDMMNNLKLVSVNPMLCSGYTIKIVKSFNTITFEKTNQMGCGR